MASPESSSTLAATSFCAAAIRGGLLLAQRGYFAERVNAGDKANLRLEDIANPGQHLLMEKYIGDLFMAVRQHAAHAASASNSELSTSIAGRGILVSRASESAVCIRPRGRESRRRGSRCSQS